MLALLVLCLFISTGAFAAFHGVNDETVPKDFLVSFTAKQKRYMRFEAPEETQKGTVAQDLTPGDEKLAISAVTTDIVTKESRREITIIKNVNNKVTKVSLDLQFLCTYSSPFGLLHILLGKFSSRKVFHSLKSMTQTPSF